MTEREALKLALKAMKRIDEVTPTAMAKCVIPEIEQALAQPEQEPVAWMNDMGTHIDLNVSGRGKPLYTTPPQRKPLTDEEFRAILRSLSRQQGWDGDGWDLALKEAIEAAHGIGCETTLVKGEA